MIANGETLKNTYQIIREIDHGGTGVIFLAWHLNLQKYIVVKKIKDHIADKVNIRNEADILKDLHHSYLPQVYDFVQVGSSVYTVMDYIEGRNLQEYINRNIPIGEDQILIWMKQLCEVLEYLHGQERPILHSDIKPANIMITTQGNICLIDFNISFMNDDQKLQGISPHYAAPEQYAKAMGLPGSSSLVLDERMDIYSLAAVFYRIMTGINPDPDGTTVLISKYDIPYSEGLKAVIQKAMQIDPGRRYDSASQMLRVLEDISKADPEYRRLILTGRLSIAICGLCCVLGILMIYSGILMNREYRWKEAYSQFEEICGEQDDERIIEEGWDLTQCDDHEWFFSKHKDAGSKIYSAIAQSYYNQGDYEFAADYYEQAMELSENEVLLFDYADACLKADDYARYLGLSEQLKTVEQSEIMNVLEAEHLYINGKYEEACNYLDEVDGEISSVEIEQKADYLYADIYNAMGEYAKEIERLEDVCRTSSDKNSRRRLGQAYSRCAEAEKISSYKRNYYKKAEEIYENLAAASAPSFDDRLNYAITKIALGNQKDALHILNVMEEEEIYSGKYELYMWKCYAYLGMDTISEQEKDKLKKAYRTCVELYGNKSDDENMINLDQIMENA